MLTLCPPILRFTHVVTGTGRVLGSHFGPGEESDGIRGTDGSVGVHDC
jgi:hypothetical protein